MPILKRRNSPTSTSAIPVEAVLLGFQAPIGGRIESITGGISAPNAASSTQGLPNVDPIFTWVRLAQRIPVRIKIEHISPGAPLVAGMTCSVSVVGGMGTPVAGRDRRLFDRLESLL
jgi:multidrug resistance efflux pump